MKTGTFKKLNLGKPRRITMGLTDHEHPAISPDGEWLAFYSGEYGSISIILTNIRGQFARRLSPHGGNNTQPAWHPDGGRVAFRHQHTTGHKWEIWQTHLAGEDIDPQPVLADTRWDYKHPSFSPDGKAMAYFSDEGSPRVYHLWRLDLASGEREQLTFGDTQNHCHPVFSPDGKRLVYHAYEGIAQVEPPITNVYELDLATGGTRALTEGQDQHKHPFYVDGTVITCHHRDNMTEVRRLLAIDLRSGKQVELTTGKYNDKHPFPWVDRKGRRHLAWACKKLGGRMDVEPSTYDIFMAPLKD